MISTLVSRLLSRRKFPVRWAGRSIAARLDERDVAAAADQDAYWRVAPE
jgi:hypothetical protein